MKLAIANADTVRIFTSGNSQAIRLPKKFRLPGQTARIERKGKSLVITPEEDVWARFDRGVAGLAVVWEGFDRKQPKSPDRRGDIFP
ncbi:MAG: antitoxin [Terrimicrobiaceae bacterium]